MPHSKTKRSHISKHMQSIVTHLKKLQNLHEKHLHKAKVIHHPSVTLGELRANFTPHHKSIPPDLLANIQNFHRVKSNPARPLFI